MNMTENAPLCTFRASSEMPPDDRDALLEHVRTVADIAETGQRQLAAEWLLFVAVMKGVGAAAGAAAAMVKLANEINTWRRNARERGVDTNVRCERPGKKTLNLADATDEEVTDWFTST